MSKKIAGLKSNEIKKVLGYHKKDVVIHRDDMVIKMENTKRKIINLCKSSVVAAQNLSQTKLR